MSTPISPAASVEVDEEAEERARLIAWFMARYPTPEARMLYAIRKKKLWREVQRRGEGYVPPRSDDEP